MAESESNTPKLVADVLVIAEGQVLLVRYTDLRRYDGQPGWFLPDDMVAWGEHPSDTAKRILLEQVELKLAEVPLSYIASFGTEGGGRWQLVFHHKVELEKLPSIRAAFNVREAIWFPLNALPEAKTVAHEGWALGVIQEMTKEGHSAGDRSRS
jgi:ADP-ribose pyrophosphatase YjhB (NUDIX family)